MARPPKAEGAKVPVSLRFTRSTLDAIEADAARRGWTRQQWFDQVAAAQLRRGDAAARVPAPSFPARPHQPVSRLRRDVTPIPKGRK